MQGAFIINPYDVEEIAIKIDEAINSSSQEKNARMEHIYEFINSHTTLKWAQRFLVDLKKSYDAVGSQYLKMGFGLNWQIIKSK